MVLLLNFRCRQQVMCFSLSLSLSFHSYASATPAVRISLLIQHQALLKCNRTLSCCLQSCIDSPSQLLTFHPSARAVPASLLLWSLDGMAGTFVSPPILAEPSPHVCSPLSSQTNFSWVHACIFLVS